MNAQPNIAFFGTPDRAVIVLDELKKAGIFPSLVVTQPDRPVGRKLAITPPPAKLWAEKENVPVLQPEDLSAPDFITTLKKGNFDAFVVVAYGKILKNEILSIPKYGCLNLHASLLPLLRGSCPIETAILEDMRETGITIILMDEKMDHGPILAQKKILPPVWPLAADDLAALLVREGGILMANALRNFISGRIQPKKQDHSKATYTKKIVKEDGHIDLSHDPYKNFLKWNAYKGWPGTFFFEEKGGKRIRVNISDATFENGTFLIKKVIPESKKEMPWEEFKRMK